MGWIQEIISGMSQEQQRDEKRVSPLVGKGRTDRKGKYLFGVVPHDWLCKRIQKQTAGGWKRVH